MWVRGLRLASSSHFAPALTNYNHSVGGGLYTYTYHRIVQLYIHDDTLHCRSLMLMPAIFCQFQCVGFDTRTVSLIGISSEGAARRAPTHGVRSPYIYIYIYIYMYMYIYIYIYIHIYGPFLVALGRYVWYRVVFEMPCSHHGCCHISLLPRLDLSHLPCFNMHYQWEDTAGARLLHHFPHVFETLRGLIWGATLSDSMSVQCACPWWRRRWGGCHRPSSDMFWGEGGRIALAGVHLSKEVNGGMVALQWPP